MERDPKKINFHLEKPRSLKKYFYRSCNIEERPYLSKKGGQEFLDKYKRISSFFAFLFIFSLFGKHFYFPAASMKDLFPLPSLVYTEKRTETLSAFAFNLLPLLF